MKKTLSTLLVLTSLLLIQACGRPVPPQDSCNFVTNSKSQRVSWPETERLRIYVHSSVPESYWPSIEASVDHWNEIFRYKGFNGDKIVLASGVTGPTSPKRDGYSVIYLMHKWESNKSTEQARTTVYWTGTRIYEADVRLNEKDFDFFLTEQPDYNKVHLESLMIHEIGHVLGLAHNTANGSVMNASLLDGYVRDDISASDLGSLSCEYF